MAGELTPEQVQRIAALAGLSLRDDEVPVEAERLSSVLGHMACLGELDLEGVRPLSQASEEHSRVRADEPGDVMSAEDAVGLAPVSHESVDSDGNATRYFRVPKVLGSDGLVEGGGSA
ncbi:MAG: Asp-tRNA(Asn)/Glu-tRNA(Gln) amidotransferase subunit GatC [Planctomycetota bacterium]